MLKSYLSGEFSFVYFYGNIGIRRVKLFLNYLKSASNLNDNLNCSKELEHYAS